MAYTVTAVHNVTGQQLVFTGIVQDGVFDKTLNSSPIRYFQNEARERIELPMEHYVVKFSSERQDMVDQEERQRLERQRALESGMTRLEPKNGPRK